MGEQATISSTGKESTRLEAEQNELFALVIAWCADEPARIGEVAFIEPGVTETLGRGEGDGEPRVRFFRQRPGRLTPTEPLVGRALSRNQLTLKGGTDDCGVTRLGRCPLFVNGLLVDTAVLGVGDTLLLRGQLLLYCTRRDRSTSAPAYLTEGDLPAFGEPDGHGILGEAPTIWHLREQLAFVAKASKHVLLHGESGTGKELAAHAIHRLSPRKARTFVARNAATLPASLIDAELFGNARNYPNAGMPERPGLIGDADAGTLFLDEIGELPLEQQGHFLRVLDSRGEYQRLGDSTTRRSVFVLVAATNREPRALKHDVLARLPLRIEVPALDARREDIPLLVRHLLLLAAKATPELGARFVVHGGPRDEVRIEPELLEVLMSRTYETNVRELDAILWRAMGASTGDTVILTDELRKERTPVERNGEPGVEQIRAALKQADGNHTGAARILGLKNRFALYRLMKRLGVDAGESEE
jgi:two-component system response regulator HydG